MTIEPAGLSWTLGCSEAAVASRVGIPSLRHLSAQKGGSPMQSCRLEGPRTLRSAVICLLPWLAGHMAARQHKRQRPVSIQRAHGELSSAASAPQIMSAEAAALRWLAKGGHHWRTLMNQRSDGRGGFFPSVPAPSAAQYIEHRKT